MLDVCIVPDELVDSNIFQNQNAITLANDTVRGGSR